VDLKKRRDEAIKQALSTNGLHIGSNVNAVEPSHVEIDFALVDQGFVNRVAGLVI
jgi:hypothetical protein